MTTEANKCNEFCSVPLTLMSVGCGIDGHGMVYPMFGWDVKTKLMSYDMENGTHINDIELDGDWALALSEDDRESIKIMLARTVDQEVEDHA